MNEESSYQSKLAAIFYADVAGYSRLTGQDEVGTHRTLCAYLDLITAAIKRYGGEVEHFAGDAILADFGTVGDALACAAHVQQALAARNQSLPDDQQVQFRIGINLGDVIVDRNDIYGNGVNVAARLESLAEPGGICISDAARLAVGTKLPIEYDFIGEQSVKNIAEPVRAYRVRIPEDIELPPGPRALKPRFRQGLWVATAVLAIALISGIVFWRLGLEPATNPVPSALAESVLAMPTGPSIAVLPFDNFSGDPKQDYFADGFTDDLITALATFPHIGVIARNSSFVYKDKPTPIQEVARELTVDYVLEGSVRRSGATVLVSAQLIDGRSGQHVWAERFNQQSDDVFALQEAIIGEIANMVAADSGRIKQSEYQQAWAKSPTALEEYDYYLRGHSFLMRSFSKKDHEKAREIWTEGLQRFPDSPLLRAKLAVASFTLTFFSDNPDQEWRSAFELATAALAADRPHTIAKYISHYVLTKYYAYHKQYDRALIERERVLALAPNDALALGGLSEPSIWMGRFDEAEALVQKAHRWNPQWTFYHLFMGQLRYEQGDYRQAIAELKLYPWLNGDITALLWQAVSFAELGDNEQAHALTPAMQKIDPDISLETVVRFLPYQHQERLERTLASLRKAGLPE